MLFLRKNLYIVTKLISYLKSYWGFQINTAQPNIENKLKFHLGKQNISHIHFLTTSHWSLHKRIFQKAN